MNKKEILQKTAEELFFMAKQIGQAAADIAFTPYGQLRIRKIPRATYYYNLKKFEKSGLIKKSAESKSLYILTERAKQLRRGSSVKIGRTDGLSTIVLFDIPEDKHKLRDSLRRYLIRNGYTQVQKSIFISPFKVFPELVEFIKELGVAYNVNVISGKIDRLT